MSDEPYVNVDFEEASGFKIAVVEMNRPKKLNAWGKEMQDAVMGALASLGQDDTVHAAIITGSGASHLYSYIYAPHLGSSIEVLTVLGFPVNVVID